MDSRIRQLLDTIVNQYEVPMEEKAAELSNPTTQAGINLEEALGVQS